MIPFQKIFTLTIRTFSKPVLALIRKKHNQNKLGAFRHFFIYFGRKYHGFQYFLNHRLIKNTQKQTLAELKEEVLLQKGVEAFYQIMFYCIVIGLPLHEVYKSAVSTQQKQEKLKKNIVQLEATISKGDENRIIDLSEGQNISKAALIEQRNNKMKQKIAEIKQMQASLALQVLEQSLLKPEQSLLMPEIESKEETSP